MTRKLVKKYRIDEVWDTKLNCRIGLYVDPKSGIFYARIPETEEGTFIEHSSIDLLRQEVRKEIQVRYALTWTPHLLVSYAHPMHFSREGRSSSAVHGWMSGRGTQWDAQNQDTASDVIGPLMFQGIEVATRSDGAKVQRRYEPHLPPEFQRASYVEQHEVRDGEVLLPYTEATREALVEFQRRIRLLDHAIRTMLISEEFLPRLLSLQGILQIPGPSEEVK